MQNSQFPAVGVPDPTPTEFARFSGTTQDCSADVVLPKVVPCPYEFAHWLTIVALGSPPDADMVPTPEMLAFTPRVALGVIVPTPERVAFPAPVRSAERVPTPERVAAPRGPPCAVSVPTPVMVAVPEIAAV